MVFTGGAGEKLFPVAALFCRETGDPRYREATQATCAIYDQHFVLLADRGCQVRQLSILSYQQKWEIPIQLNQEVYPRIGYHSDFGALS